MKQLYLFPETETESEQTKGFKNKNIPEDKILKHIDFVEKRKIFSSKEEYYKSEEWKKKRAFALHRANNRCERCGYSKTLQVHHLTYDRLYNEKPEDFEVLCKDCHKKADEERKDQVRYDRGFDTYMTKKYGDEYEFFDGCFEEYDDWLERTDDDW